MVTSRLCHSRLRFRQPHRATVAIRLVLNPNAAIYWDQPIRRSSGPKVLPFCATAVQNFPHFPRKGIL